MNQIYNKNESVKKMYLGSNLIYEFKDEYSSESNIFYKCVYVDESNKTWDGLRAILIDGVYTFERIATQGLNYSDIIPEAGNIYSKDALLKIDYIYQGLPNARVNLPLTGDYIGTIDGISTDFSSGAVGSLQFSDGALNFSQGDYLNLSNITTTLLSSDFTIFMRVNQSDGYSNTYLSVDRDYYISIKDNGKDLWIGNGSSWSILQCDDRDMENYSKGSIAIPSNKDSSIALVHKNNTWKLYIDGDLSVEKTWSGRIPRST